MHKFLHCLQVEHARLHSYHPLKYRGTVFAYTCFPGFKWAFLEITFTFTIFAKYLFCRRVGPGKVVCGGKSWGLGEPTVCASIWSSSHLHLKSNAIQLWRFSLTCRFQRRAVTKPWWMQFPLAMQREKLTERFLVSGDRSLPRFSTIQLFV